MNRSIQILIYIAFYSLLPLLVSAQSTINNAVNALVDDSDLKYAGLSFCAIDIDANKIVAEKNANMALAPASSMKVITTGSALAILGKDYKFKTEIQYSGSIESGVLKGNLYIKGGGDPTLGSPIMSGVPTMSQVMADFVKAVKDAGITKVEGDIIGDASFFEQASVVPTWQWADVGNHYGAGVNGLNLHDNIYYLKFKQKSSFGSTPSIASVSPKLPQLDFTNEVTHAGKGTGDNAYIYTAPYGVKSTVRGTIPVGSGEFQIKGAIPNPPLFASYSFKNALVSSGVKVSGGYQAIFENDGASKKTIHTHYSPDLLTIAKHTNEDSRNMYCEALIKAMGVKKKNQGTREAGIAAIMDFWTSRGIDMRGFFMQDGSGLSARNGISSKTFAQIMRKMYIDESTFGDFYNQLAIAGQTGTLKYVGKGTAAAGNVRAKSGSMNRIRSYTGYVKTKKGTMLSFSIIVHNYSCSGSMMRRKLANIMVAMAEETDI